MPDTGAPHFIPFADPTDLVRDWPALSEDVAEQVAVGLDAAGSAGIGSNVVQAVKTDTFSWNVNGLQDVPDLSASITPSSNTSKILCLVHLNFGVNQTGDNWTAGATLFRGATALYVGSTTPNPLTIGWTNNSPGNRANSTGVAMFLDSPATDAATTYKISVQRFQSATFFINRRGDDSSVSWRVPSSLTLIEVAA